MKALKLVVVLVIVAAVAAWGYRKFFPSDETQIRKLLASAAERVSIRPNDTGLSKISSVKWLMDHCTSDVQLSVEAPGYPARTVQGREQLGEMLAGIHGLIQSLSLDLMEVDVKLAEDPNQATAQFIARVKADGIDDQIVQEFKVTLKRDQGDWKFQRIEPLSSLKV